jgi:hypothetical protein
MMEHPQEHQQQQILAAEVAVLEITQAMVVLVVPVLSLLRTITPSPQTEM